MCSPLALTHYVISDILVLKLISVLVFILFNFFIVGEILQPSGGHMQGKGILIAGMAPDLSYDNTRSERLNFLGNEMKIKLVANIYYSNSSRFRSFPVSKF